MKAHVLDGEGVSDKKPLTGRGKPSPAQLVQMSVAIEFYSSMSVDRVQVKADKNALPRYPI